MNKRTPADANPFSACRREQVRQPCGGGHADAQPEKHHEDSDEQANRSSDHARTDARRTGNIPMKPARDQERASEPLKGGSGLGTAAVFLQRL
jgi:hypothetical protein